MRSCSGRCGLPSWLPPQHRDHAVGRAAFSFPGLMPGRPAADPGRTEPDRRADQKGIDLVLSGSRPRAVRLDGEGIVTMTCRETPRHYPQDSERPVRIFLQRLAERGEAWPPGHFNLRRYRQMSSRLRLLSRDFDGAAQRHRKVAGTPICRRLLGDLVQGVPGISMSWVENMFGDILPILTAGLIGGRAWRPR